jgi:hypothetical protein
LPATGKGYKQIALYPQGNYATYIWLHLLFAIMAKSASLGDLSKNRNSQGLYQGIVIPAVS